MPHIHKHGAPSDYIACEYMSALFIVSYTKILIEVH